MDAEDTTQADAIVAAWVLKQYRQEHVRPLTVTHKSACPDASVQEVETTNGTYGCDTGCEYSTFKAQVTCPHEPPEDYTYGTFGDLPWILESIFKGDE